MIVLLRQMISHGFALDNAGQLTDAEKGFLQVANKDLGREPAVDWRLKRHLLELLHPKDNLFQCPSFRRLRYHQNLRKLFYDNMQFRLVSRVVFNTSDTSSSRVTASQLPFTSEILWNKNQLFYKGTNSLADFITSIFNSSPTESQFASLRPKFLFIRYSNVNKDRPISEFRILRFQAPEARAADNKWKLGVQHATYHPCAIVRCPLENEFAERIRTYWKDGSEIVPAEIGDFKAKEPEAMDIAQWKLQDPGNYMLFYYRIPVPQGWPTSEMDIVAAESEPRPWAFLDEDEGSIGGRYSPPSEPEISSGG